MKYQLVIQMKARSIEDCDSLIELEDSLSTAVGTSADVDGHDFGSGEANIFVITPDPTATFAVLKQVLESKGILAQCTVAHRKLDGEEYTVLWPEGSTETFTVQ
jgi:hypothetical protein